jgi:hypothetical protein
VVRLPGRGVGRMLALETPLLIAAHGVCVGVGGARLSLVTTHLAICVGVSALFSGALRGGVERAGHDLSFDLGDLAVRQSNQLGHAIDADALA